MENNTLETMTRGKQYVEKKQQHGNRERSKQCYQGNKKRLQK